MKIHGSIIPPKPTYYVEQSSRLPILLGAQVAKCLPFYQTWQNKGEEHEY